MAPVLGRLEPCDGDAAIAPGIDVRFAPGHAPPGRRAAPVGLLQLNEPLLSHPFA
jgi:hypothetical protein